MRTSENRERLRDVCKYLHQQKSSSPTFLFLHPQRAGMTEEGSFRAQVTPKGFCFHISSRIGKARPGGNRVSLMSGGVPDLLHTAALV